MKITCSTITMRANVSFVWIISAIIGSIANEFNVNALIIIATPFIYTTRFAWTICGSWFLSNIYIAHSKHTKHWFASVYIDTHWTAQQITLKLMKIHTQCWWRECFFGMDNQILWKKEKKYSKWVFCVIKSTDISYKRIKNLNNMPNVCKQKNSCPFVNFVDFACQIFLVIAIFCLKGLKGFFTSKIKHF